MDFIYYSDTARGKKFFSHTKSGHFLGMNSSTRLGKIYSVHNKKIRSVRQSDFGIYRVDIRPGVEATQHGFKREVENEQEVALAKCEEKLTKNL